MAQCSVVMKRKDRSCEIYADRFRSGEWFCHVHDPDGAFQQQQGAKRAERQTRTKFRPPKKEKFIRPRREVENEFWRTAPPLFGRKPK